MDSSQIHHSLSSDQILNGNNTKVYSNGTEYSGTWENGLKVGEGILTKGRDKIRVKTKEGKIYKCIKVLEISKLKYTNITKFPLPSIKVTKFEDHYKEEASDITEYFFIHENGQVLFDGKPCVSCEDFSVNQENLEFFKGRLSDSKPLSPFVLDILAGHFRFIGEISNCIPNGLIKAYANDIVFKGVMKGILFCGRCSIKNQIFKVILDLKLSIWKTPFKVISKVLNFEISMMRSPYCDSFIPDKIGINVDLALAFLPEILEFIHQIDNGLYDIYKRLEDFNLSNLLVSFCLIDKTWNLVEKRHSINECSFDVKRFDADEEKCFRELDNNEIFEGRILNGNLDGFGKYFYSDGSVYAGEFKDNLKDGLGTFKFKDGRVYRGYWKNNLMDGKGYIIAEGFKICGVWKKNKIIQESSCIVYELKK